MSKRRTIIPKGFEFYSEQFHFAPAVLDGDTLYCSGQVGWAGPGSKAPTDPAEQFKVAFENLRQVLEAAGTGFENVVEITTFHVGMEHINAFGAVKAQYLKKPDHAWTAIGVAALFMPGLYVEIRATAKV